MKKIGNEYLSVGGKRKRSVSAIVWCTIWGILSISWIIFMFILAHINGFIFDFSKEMFATVLICCIPLAIFMSGLLLILSFNKLEGIIEFRIHEYERWNYQKSVYEKYYIVERVTLISKYIFFVHIGDYLDIMNDVELEKYCLNLPDDWNTFIAYKTKDEAMLNIVSTIKDLIKDEKASNNVKIRNVKTTDIFAMDDIFKNVAEGKYDHLTKKEKK